MIDGSVDVRIDSKNRVEIWDNGLLAIFTPVTVGFDKTRI